MAAVKGRQSLPGGGGVAAVHDLDGRELTRWRNRGCTRQLFEALPLARQTPALAARADRLGRWLTTLHDSLLHKEAWSMTHRGNFHTFLVSIQQWHSTTGLPVPPKLHMLSHCLPFAQQHGALGLFAESQIESFHSLFNSLYRITHRNTSHRSAERLRRCLADSALVRLAPTMPTDPARAKFV